MNDEIKEIFDTKLYFDLEEEDYIKIKDYITNLQQDMKNYVDIVLYQRKTIDNLQQENERLKKLNENASKVCMAEHRYGVDKAEEARDYKFRCEKAIEYINDNTYYKNHLGYVNLDDLLNILQNGSDE